MQRVSILAILLLLQSSFFSACNRSSRVERQDPESISLAKKYFELLRQGNYEQLEKAFDPSIKVGVRVAYDGLVGTIPTEEPTSAKPTLAYRVCQEGICESHIVIEYTYGEELLLFNVVLRHVGTQVSIIGMNIRTIPAALIAANKFRILNEGFGQYTMMLMAILFPLISLYAVFICGRSKIGLRKWFWIPIMLIGFSRLGINWTTGRLDFQFAAAQVLSVSAFAEQYGPWTISVSLPIGAIIYLLAHRFSYTGRNTEPAQNQTGPRKS